MAPPRTRPAVRDAARTALIPLRPLTPGEILDGAFVVVRRNVAGMLGLPLVVAGAAAGYVLAGVGLWFLLGNSTSRTVQVVLTVLMGLLGLLLVTQCLVWLTAMLSRVTLQTVLGAGFAPAAPVGFRASRRLFWPVLGLSVLQYLALGVVQSAITGLYVALLVAVSAAGLSEDALGFGVLGLSAVGYLLAAVAYGYLSLTVPALAVESRHAPPWIGRPARPTTVISSFERAVRLVGWRQLGRVAAVVGGTLAICGAVVLAVASGVLLVVLLFTSSLQGDVGLVLRSPWTVLGVTAFATVLSMSAVLAYVAAVQTLLYLDLRMRREGLDLALRFDCVPVPQPAWPSPAGHPAVPR